MRANYRRYLRSFIPAMLGYVMVLFASVFVLKAFPNLPTFARISLSLAPVLPIVFVCRAVVVFVRDSDELERKIDLEAIALSCLITGLLFMSLGFLASSKLFELDGAMMGIMVLPCLFGFFGLTKCITQRRYR
jgi:uncharacterized membrane protein (DUF373 family)